MAITDATKAGQRQKRLKEFVEITALKREIEGQLKDAKARLGELEPLIAEHFTEEGMQSVNVDGYTIYLNRRLFAGPMDGDREAMVAALEVCDDESWKFLVKKGVNSQQLSARVRECEVDENSGMPSLPDGLRQTIKVYEEFRIGARKG